MQPCHDLVASKQAELLFQIKLEGTQINRIFCNSLNKITSGSVRQRPMAIIPDVKTPSVKMGPKKFCIFGVKRKGTASFEANIGAWLATPGIAN